MNSMQIQPPTNDPLGWAAIVIGTIATLYTIVAAIYWLIRPGETDTAHPKLLILKDNR